WSARGRRAGRSTVGLSTVAPAVRNTFCGRSTPRAQHLPHRQRRRSRLPRTLRYRTGSARLRRLRRDRSVGQVSRQREGALTVADVVVDSNRAPMCATVDTKGVIMGLAWQQGPLASGSVGHFLAPEPLPPRLLYAEPLRRRMRVQLAGEWIADSDDVLLLHEPGHYPVSYFPIASIRADALQRTDRTTQHRDLGATVWFTVRAGDRSVERAAWQFVDLPDFAGVLSNRIAFAWRAMDAFYEEDERIVGHAAGLYPRNDIPQTSPPPGVPPGDRAHA